MPSKILRSLRVFQEAFTEDVNSLAVDFGCGSLPRNPLRCARVIGIDILELEHTEKLPFTFDYIRHSEEQPLPIAEASVDVVYAYDFLEHLSRSPSATGPNQFIRYMNTIHGLLKSGGILFAVTPAFPSESAFADPTHVNFITERTHLYFADHIWAQQYGYGFEGAFETVMTGWSSPVREPALWNRFGLEETKKPKPLQRIFRRIFPSGRPSHLVWLLRKR